MKKRPTPLGGQAGKAVAFRREGIEFESAHRRSTALLGGPVSAAVPLLQNDVYYHFIKYMI